ncbi:MAG: PEP/pyruvate-binding domain-containing protein [Planctomycetota bacterium]
MPRRHRPLLTLLATTAMFASGTSTFAQFGPQSGGRGRDRGPMRSLVLEALDTDGDHQLSDEEVSKARSGLLKLDQNGDGNLEADELMPRRGNEEGRRGGPPGPGGFPGMRRMDPIVAALDKDNDGELFEDEVVDAATSLARLDVDKDGTIREGEIRPSRGGFPGGPEGRGGPGGPGGFRGGEGGSGGKVVQPEELGPEQGAARLTDRETFERLSYQGQEVMVDTQLAGLEFVKFQLEGAGTDSPRLYFMNTNTFRSHPEFMNAMGLPRSATGRMRGVLVFWPQIKSPNGEAGLYTFEFEPNDAFPYDMIRVCYDLLEKNAPMLVGKLAYNVLEGARTRWLEECELYEKGALPTFQEADRYANVAFLPLHEGEAFGRLRVMDGTELPESGDVVIYRSPPNEMPRVSGVITAQRQTPLSHVNLRAVQDGIPNAFVEGLLTNPQVLSLLGKFVRYSVRADGYVLREASSEEVEAHRQAVRPRGVLTPPRNLDVKDIRSFSDIGFGDSDSFGVKAANLAVLSRLDLAGAEAPSGFAIPFHYYVEFMKFNGFDDMAARMVATDDFRASTRTREESLKEFRKAIKKGKVPDWMSQALKAVQARLPEGTAIRCRSSTNNEDLPGFSGAGLYDSFTHRADEGDLEKSIKQVYASLWNFRAFEEREFFRVPHDLASMGVVLQPSTSDEHANGVAVTRDALYGTEEQVGVRFYVNAQVGEDLVTNPEQGSTPEELLLAPRNPKNDRVIRRSSRTGEGAPLLGAPQLLVLRRALRTVDREFRQLYGITGDQEFAMEVEFKITSTGAVFLKQARPWVFR